MRAALTGFTVRFGAAIVLDRIDLSIAPGEVTALIGESGCGKSLVASALCGLLPPGLLASGEVWIGDRALASGDAQWTSIRGHVVGLVPQSPATSFTPVRTIGAQLREVIDVLGSDRSPQELCAAAALDLEALELFPHELSGGMAQRAAVAAALVGDPAVLIADEPTSALDAQTAHQVLATLRRRADDGASVLVITHDLASVLAVGCDRIAVMRSGRIVAHGAASGPDAVTASASAAQESGPDLRDYVRAFFEEVR